MKDFRLIGTGTTMGLLGSIPDLSQTERVKVNSGPVGGDVEIAAMAVKKEVDALIFFVDPMSNQPHTRDIQMLIRQCILHNIPMALNYASAQLLIDSISEKTHIRSHEAP